MSRAAQIFPKGGLKAKLYTFGFALIGYSVLVLSLNNRNLNHYEEQAITDTTKSRAVTSNLNSSPSQAAANSTLRANQTKMHTNLSSVLLSSDYQSHVEEKYLLFWPHGGFQINFLDFREQHRLHTLPSEHWSFHQFYLIIHSIEIFLNIQNLKQKWMDNVTRSIGYITISNLPKNLLIFLPSKLSSTLIPFLKRQMD